MAKQNEPDFGAEVLSAPDNVPVSTQGIQRPTVLSNAGKNVQRKASRQLPAGNPYKGGSAWNHEHAGLLGFDFDPS